VGKPIKVTQIDNPTKAQVEKVHEQYLDALQKLYDEYKDEFHAYRTQEMRFVA
jgi:hypothetical protein